MKNPTAKQRAEVKRQTQTRQAVKRIGDLMQARMQPKIKAIQQDTGDRMLARFTKTM